MKGKTFFKDDICEVTTPKSIIKKLGKVIEWRILDSKGNIVCYEYVVEQREGGGLAHLLIYEFQDAEAKPQ